MLNEVRSVSVPDGVARIIRLYAQVTTTNEPKVRMLSIYRPHGLSKQVVWVKVDGLPPAKREVTQQDGTLTPWEGTMQAWFTLHDCLTIAGVYDEGEQKVHPCYTSYDDAL